VRTFQSSGLATSRYWPAGRSVFSPPTAASSTPSQSPPQHTQRDSTPQQTGRVSHSPENRTAETPSVRCECTALASGERQARKGEVRTPSSPRRPRVLQCEGRDDRTTRARSAVSTSTRLIDAQVLTATCIVRRWRGLSLGGLHYYWKHQFRHACHGGDKWARCPLDTVRMDYTRAISITSQGKAINALQSPRRMPGLPGPG